MLEDATESIGRLGYTPEESQFLLLAAIHSGYFVRRQFSDFLGHGRGGAEARFVEKLLERRYAQVINPRGNRLLYHLHAKQLYGRLGQTDNRNRRDKMPLTIKRKLMCLDFVLMHREHRLLGLEAEKVHYFIQERGISLDKLPVRRYPAHHSSRVTDRYFVDKLPVYVSASQSLPAPVVHFAYVDEGAESLDGFETFLRQYRDLCVALGDFEIAYVAAEPRWTDRAKRNFEHFYPASGSVLLPEQQRMLAFFQTRRKFDIRQFSGLDAERIARFREEKREFASAQHEQLYGRWLAEGDSAIQIAPSSGVAMQGRFRAVVFSHDYNLFGGLRRAS
jgi:hypothetical protein